MIMLRRGGGGGAALQLRCNSLAGELCIISADSSWRTAEAKRAVEEKTGIPAREQRLVVGTSEVCDQAPLGSWPKATGMAAVVEVVVLRRTAQQMQLLEDLDMMRPWEVETWFTTLPEDFRGDRDLVLTALQRGGGVLHLASPALCLDREIAFAGLKQIQQHPRVARRLPEQLRAEIGRKLLRKHLVENLLQSLLPLLLAAFMFLCDETMVCLVALGIPMVASVLFASLIDAHCQELASNFECFRGYLKVLRALGHAALVLYSWYIMLVVLVTLHLMMSKLLGAVAALQ